jgi:phosphatidylserine/phosphatidylglycerophosphate/cardiolipin synthase-like enzyme
MNMSKPLRDLAYGNLLQVADSLESGRLVPPFTPFSLSRLLRPDQSVTACQELNRLHESGMQIPHLVYVLRVVAEERLSCENSAPSVDLVWTGPEVPGAESRDTSVLIAELFGTAERSVLVAGFAIAQGKKIFKALSDRMLAIPDLRVRMFLNVARPFRDTTLEEELLKRFADKFRLHEWPGGKLPELYYDRRTLSTDDFERSSLHAKCVVIDEEKALVTSANFTVAAQIRNIEAGVFVGDPKFARSLVRQFDALVSSGLLCRIPGL